jgi:hypothetical protein
MDLNRRDVLLWAAAGSALFASGATAEAPLAMVVFRDPTCGCCHKWVEHLEANGFKVTVHDAPSMKAVKRRLGVPPEIASCHTGEIGDYVIEGHVPAAAIKRLLAEKPPGRGLAVPGMPVGSPGMEVAGSEPEIYEVLLFGAGAPKSFGKFREDKAV